MSRLSVIGLLLAVALMLVAPLALEQIR